MLFQYYGYGRFGPFSEALLYLERMGLLDAIIPFILIFSIFYAVLDQVKILENKRVNAVVALSVSLLTVVPHILGMYPPGADVVQIINRALPEIALIMIAIFLVMVLTGLIIGKKPDDADTTFKSVAKWAALILVAVVFWGAMTPQGYLPGFLNFFTDPYFYSIMIILLVFGLVIFLVVGGDDEEKKKRAAAAAARGNPPV